MSRWAMMLPIVARRSPAITTPPGKVAATIVVPCGARSPALPRRAATRARRAAGRAPGSARKSAEGRRARASGTPPGARAPPMASAHWPPFWMNDFTKSSALVSSTSSISSRIASTSSSSVSLRSATSVSVRDLGGLVVGLARTCAAASAPVPCLDPTSELGPTSAERARRLRSSRAVERSRLRPGQRPSSSSRRSRSGRAARRRAPCVPRSGSMRRDPLQRLAPGQVEDHRVPGRGGDVRRRTSPGSGRGSRRGCPRAASCMAALDLVVVEQPLDPAARRRAGGRGPSPGGRRSTAGRSAAASASSQSSPSRSR